MLEETSDEDPTRIKRRQGGKFEQRVAGDDHEALRSEVRGVIKKTIGWPSMSQSIKGVVTGGIGRTWRYLSEKRQKYNQGRKAQSEETNRTKRKEDGEGKE